MNLTNSEILEIIYNNLSKEDLNHSFIYWHKKIFSKGEKITSGSNTIEMPFEGTLVFADLSPEANWAHPCLFILIDSKGFEVQLSKASFPPNVDQSDLSYIILLRYGLIPPNEHYFSTFDK